MIEKVVERFRWSQYHSGLTMQGLADAIGTSLTRVSRILKGEQKLDAETLYLLSELLDVRVGWLFDEVSAETVTERLTETSIDKCETLTTAMRNAKYQASVKRPAEPEPVITVELEAGMGSVKVRQSQTVLALRDAGLTIDQIAEIKGMERFDVFQHLKAKQKAKRKSQSLRKGSIYGYPPSKNTAYYEGLIEKTKEVDSLLREHPNQPDTWHATQHGLKEKFIAVRRKSLGLTCEIAT